ncbi:MAG: guanylate kinase [Pirellulaceae bacterium]
MKWFKTSSSGEIDVPNVPGKLIILSGPSGAGKSTVVSRLLRDCPLPLELSVSATTRKPRAGEENGVNYWFIDDDDFQNRRMAGEFLECFEVFGRGIWYGTLKKPVTTGLNAGKWVILEIDVQGARSAFEHFPDAITLFVHPGSLEELETRLRGRKSENDEAIRRRLEVAREELAAADWYQHVVVNAEIEQTVSDICHILESYREK